ncbi:MAG: TetR/AcrR family transcriptional regulator [Myxococcota bacterium]
MPKQVDHDARRAEIGVAALRILAEQGPGALTIRSLADALGGSTTLITHYFPSRQKLVEGLAAYLLEHWQREAAELRRQGGGTADLRALLVWMLPLSEWARLCERARLSLQAASGEDRKLGRGLLRTIDRWMRAELNTALTPHVPDEAVRERLVDVLRAAVAGVVLTSAEHPDEWPAERQLAVVDELLGRLGLG